MSKPPSDSDHFRPELPDFDEKKLPGSAFTHHTIRRTLLAFGSIGLLVLPLMAIVPVDVTVDGPGTLEPVAVWPVYSPMEGAVATVHVSTGDTVHEGQLLISLDSLELEGRLDQLELQYAEARLRYRRAMEEAPLKASLARSQASQSEAAVMRARAQLRQQMVDYGVDASIDSMLASYVSGVHATLDVAVSNVLASQADYQSRVTAIGMLELDTIDRQRDLRELRGLRAEIELARTRLGRLHVRSPTAGVVLTTQVEQLVGSRPAPGTLVLELGGLGAWRAVLWVRGRDLQRVRIGDRVKLDVEALRETSTRMLRGRVTFVAPQPTGAEQPGRVSSPVFRVEATLDEHQLAAIGRENLRRGYAVRGKIITRSEPVLKILWVKLTAGAPRGV